MSSRGLAGGSLAVPLAEDRPLVRTAAGSLTSGRTLALATSLAQTLPSAPAAVNLCERRENFLVGFLALLIRGQACLLPPSRAPDVVAEVLREHPGAWRLDDAAVERLCSVEDLPPGNAPEVDPDRVVVVGYTSGSTGRPKANPKAWGSFVASTRLNAERLREVIATGGAGSLPWIVATVPSQHMYGMEMSVLLPLLAGMAIHGGHPLYPADVAAALGEVPAPRVLVTTPVHLRALLQSGVDLPTVAAIVSATAPLTRELAGAVEQRFQAPLLEFFGSTETCVIASRRPATGAAWRTYAGVELRPHEAGTTVDAPWFPEPVELQDVVEPGEDGTFLVRGRNADMVEVGGKRASLADLTRRLLAVPGVTDAVVFQPEGPAGSVVRRLVALAVAPGLTEAEVLAGLASAMDPVFLPRPLVLVSRLPRNDVGKLPRDQLLAALRR